MKKLLAFLLLATSLAAQTTVQKNSNGVVNNGPVVFGPGASGLTIASGGNFTVAAGGNVLGLTSAFFPLSGVTAGSYTSANITVDAHGLITAAANGSGGGGAGTVTQVSASNLALLFTTNVATATTTPSITFTIANASANTFIAGPVSGSAAPLAARALVIADIPSLTLSKISDAGNSASRNVGTTTGTVAAGDDSRIVNAMQTTQNLAGLASTSTSLTNLGATLTGKSFFTTTDPSAIAYPRVNANNTLTYLSAAGFRTDIGLGGAAVLNVGTTAGTVMAGDDSRIVTAIHFVSGLSASDGPTNVTAINNALTAAAALPGTVMVVIPSGTYPLTTGTINVPLSVQLWGQGSSQGGTTITYSGSTYALKAWAPNTGAQLLWGGKISNLRIEGTSAAIGAISISDTALYNVDHCTIVGFTGTSASTGYGIELKNINQYTEDFLGSYNDIRDSRAHYKFTYTGTGTGTNSFAHTQIIGGLSVLTGANDRVILADPGADIYSSILEIKINLDVPSLTSPSTKPAMIELGAGAHITQSKLYIFQELNADHLFWRFVLGAASYIKGQGYCLITPSAGMSSLVGNANYYDSLAATAGVYIGPGGEFWPGAPGPALITAGQWATTQRAAPANNTAYPILYLSPGTAFANFVYRDATHIDYLSVRATMIPVGGGDANSTTVTILDLDSYNASPIFDRSVRPFWKLTAAGNVVLYAYLSGISGGDTSGYITATGVMESATNSGAVSDFGTMKPMVLLPDMTGISVGSPLDHANQMALSYVPFTANAIMLGGGNSIVTPMGSLGTTTTLLHGNASGAPTFSSIVNGDITNGTIDLTTKVTGVLPRANGGTGLAVAGTSGNVLTSDGTNWISAVPTGSGTGNVVMAANASAANHVPVSAGANRTIVESVVTIDPSTGNAAGFGNLSINNVTVNTTFDVSGSTWIGTLPVTAGGSGQTSYTKGDIVVATGSTTLTKVAVGADGSVLTANSSASSGVSWAASSGGGALTANLVGYGNSTNVLTGEAAFAYNPTTNIVTIGGISLGAGSEVSTIGPLVDAVDGTTPLNNINQVVATGTAYTLTTSYASLDFGTTDPVLTIANAGTYSIYVTVQTSLVSATTTTQAVTYKLRRTNNTAADLTGATFGNPLPVATITSELGPTTTIGPIKYTTTNTDDAITVQGILSASLGAGTATATACTITAIRAY